MSTPLIEQYCDLADAGADFADPRLAMLRLRMSSSEVEYVVNRLRAEGEAAMKEADALRAEADRRRATNDN